MWVIFTQAGLLVFLFQEKLEWWMGVAALLTYTVYVLHLYLATRQFRNQLSEDKPEMEATDCKTASACYYFFLSHISVALYLKEEILHQNFLSCICLSAIFLLYVALVSRVCPFQSHS